MVVRHAAKVLLCQFLLSKILLVAVDFFIVLLLFFSSSLFSLIVVILLIVVVVLFDMSVMDSLLSMLSSKMIMDLLVPDPDHGSFFVDVVL